MKNKTDHRNHYRPMGRGTPTEIRFDFEEVELLEPNISPGAILLAMEIIESLERPGDPRRGAPFYYTPLDIGLIFEMGRIQGVREEREKRTARHYREYHDWPDHLKGRPDLIYELGKIEGLETSAKKGRPPNHHERRKHPHTTTAPR